jgi:hypothetical protein
VSYIQFVNTIEILPAMGLAINGASGGAGLATVILNKKKNYSIIEHIEPHAVTGGGGRDIIRTFSLSLD